MSSPFQPSRGKLPGRGVGGAVPVCHDPKREQHFETKGWKDQLPAEHRAAISGFQHEQNSRLRI